MQTVLASDVKYGGFISFTDHLARGLGNRCVVRLSSVASSARACGSMPARFFPPEKLPRGCVVTALDWKARGEQFCMAAALGAVSAVVFHDPNDGGHEVIRTASSLGVNIILIRKSQLRRAEQITGGRHAMIVHPYTREFTDEATVERSARKLAASVSRVDFDKHTEIIVNADCGIDIFGSVNRMYAHHKLPEWWERSYRGIHNGGARTLLSYRYSVDMSLIKGDGGGTQYTTLEAWDSGAIPVLHRDWIMPGDEMVEGENCLCVGCPSELKELLGAAERGEIDEAKLVARGRECLRDHDAVAVGESLKKICAVGR